MENGKVHVKVSLNLKKSTNKHNAGATVTTGINYTKNDFISSKRVKTKKMEVFDQKFQCSKREKRKLERKLNKHRHIFLQ